MPHRRKGDRPHVAKVEWDDRLSVGVDLIDEHDYRKDVDNAIRFLSGKNDAVLIDLQTRMDQAAESLN